MKPIEDTTEARLRSVFTTGPAPQNVSIHLPKRAVRSGFTLVELLVVVVIIGVLASLLLPALAKARARAQGIMCLNNTKQLSMTWVMYADDHTGRLPYNIGGDLANRGVARATNINWVSGILDWGLTPDNTNTATLMDASLGQYGTVTPPIYRCPSDSVLSPEQRAAGWSARVRTYSMNAMVGDAGDASSSGVTNKTNPGYVQFFTLTSIPNPSRIFVFLDENPDTINDGYFLNGAYNQQWIDLPASFHNGAGTFSFADGHAEAHRWVSATTRRSPTTHPNPVLLSTTKTERSDFDWIIERMSVNDSSRRNFGSY